MLKLAAAIEANDSATVTARFQAENFAPPELCWDPKLGAMGSGKLDFLLTYWRGLKNGKPVPHLSDVDALNMAPCLGYLMMLDIGETELRYRVYGTKIAEASGFDLTGRTVSTITSHSFMPTFFNACYRAVQDKRIPLLTVHQSPPQISVYNWTRLILPLIDDTEKIARVLVGNIPGLSRIGELAR